MKAEAQRLAGRALVGSTWRHSYTRSGIIWGLVWRRGADLSNVSHLPAPTPSPSPIDVHNSSLRGVETEIGGEKGETTHHWAAAWQPRGPHFGSGQDRGHMHLHV